MNILFVTSGALPVPAVKGGAVENLVQSLLKENIKQKEWNFDVVSIHDEEALKQKDKYINTNFYFINDKKKLNIKKIFRFCINKFLSKVYIGNSFVSKVAKLKLKKNYDFVIIENAPEYVLYLKRFWKNSKFILHLHNDYLTLETKNVKEIINSYNQIWCISNFLVERVRRLTDEKDKVKILYNGIDLSLFKSSSLSKDILKQYDLEGNFIFVFSGRLVKEKGIEELIEAFKLLEKEKENVKLIIIGGKGYSNNKEDNFVKKLKKNESKNIIFTGYLNYENIQEIYSIANVGIIPSLCEDAFNLTTVEFMAMEKALIISDKGAMKEIATTKCALVVPTKDNFIESLKNAMNLIIEDEKLRLNLQKEARERAKIFSKEKFFRDFSILVKRNEEG